MPCDDSCSECDAGSVANCLECPEGYYLKNGYCLADCGSGYYPQEGT